MPCGGAAGAGLCPQELSCHRANYQIAAPVVRVLDLAHQSFLCCRNTAVLLGRAEPLACWLGETGIPPKGDREKAISSSSHESTALP